jgi:hypothetical protein
MQKYLFFSTPKPRLIYQQAFKLALLSNALLLSVGILQSPSLVKASPSYKAANSGVVSQSTRLNDTLIIPGLRFGPITRTTTYQDLVHMFGASQLSNQDVFGAEGLSRLPGTKVNLGKTRSFVIAWTNKNRTEVNEVRTTGSAWKTQQGIGVGTTLTELQRILGEFQIPGFGWDYGEVVQPKQGKKFKYNIPILYLSIDLKAAKRYPNVIGLYKGRELFYLQMLI